ncbi:MAG TPA: phenylalanine--tRNA ligase subunit alpha, partial [Bacteroidia bacterium]|nr:phenylalanine--tRNA ligase subunit alpha [Bacteroidia bacterium]
MEDKIKSLVLEVGEAKLSNADEAEQFRLKYLSKKGILTGLFDEFKTLAPEQRKVVGKQLNELKQLAEQKFEQSKELSAQNGSSSESNIDLSLPPDPIALGSRHPISLVKTSIVNIFSKIGFTISEGPEIEDDWHNFGALNFPEDHPARDMQDTFFVESDNPAEKWLLRTHTSSVQVRVMKNQK